VNALQIDPSNSNRILIGTEYQGILISEDSGKSWKPSNHGFIHQQVSWILPDSKESGRFLAGVHSGGGGFYLYDEQMRAWTLSHIEPGMRILSFLILPKDRGRLAGTEQGVYWQQDGQSRWTKLTGSIAKRTIYSLDLDPSNPVIYAGTDQRHLPSICGNPEFSHASRLQTQPRAWCIATSPYYPEFVYAGTSLGLLRSWDRGTTWNVISAFGLPDRVPIESLGISPSDKNHLLAGTAVGLFESRNGGVHWTRPADGKIAGHVTSVLFLDDSGEKILAADNHQGGSTIQEIADGLGKR